MSYLLSIASQGLKGPRKVSPRATNIIKHFVEPFHNRYDIARQMARILCISRDLTGSRQCFINGFVKGCDVGSRGSNIKAGLQKIQAGGKLTLLELIFLMQENNGLDADLKAVLNEVRYDVDDIKKLTQECEKAGRFADPNLVRYVQRMNESSQLSKTATTGIKELARSKRAFHPLADQQTAKQDCDEDQNIEALALRFR